MLARTYSDLGRCSFAGAKDGKNNLGAFNSTNQIDNLAEAHVCYVFAIDRSDAVAGS